MNYIEPNDLIDEQFERFWTGFNEQNRYSEKTKDFVRKLWHVVLHFNLHTGRSNQQPFI